MTDFFGTPGDDTFLWTSNTDRFYGGGGNDTVSFQNGTSGVNLLASGYGGDSGGYSNGYAPGGFTYGDGVFYSIERVVGTAYDDYIMGGPGSHTLSGAGGADALIGSAQGDALYGGDGNDNLVGGAGQDTLSGGAGADILIFYSLSDSAVGKAKADIITDFSHAEGDRIGLFFDAQKGVPGHQGFDFTGASKFTHHAGELIEKAMVGGYLIQGDVNGDAKSDFALFVESSAPLVASDFIYGPRG